MNSQWSTELIPTAEAMVSMIKSKSKSKIKIKKCVALANAIGWIFYLPGSQITLQVTAAATRNQNKMELRQERDVRTEKPIERTTNSTNTRCYGQHLHPNLHPCRLRG